jgi:hypothetical protein
MPGTTSTGPKLLRNLRSDSVANPNSLRAPARTREHAGRACRQQGSG